MAQNETHLSEVGATTVPKALRKALRVPHGARLRWQLETDGSLSAKVVLRYPQPAGLGASYHLPLTAEQSKASPGQARMCDKEKG